MINRFRHKTCVGAHSQRVLSHDLENLLCCYLWRGLEEKQHATFQECKSREGNSTNEKGGAVAINTCT